MNRVEKAVVLGALLYMVLYIPYFLIQVFRIESGIGVPLWAILTPHFLGMAWNLVALILTIRDLYLRPFANPNSKLTWLLLITYTGGIGWLVYIFKHAFRPRTS